MQLNNTTLVNRENKPTVNQNVGLRTYFINDGQYIDPYEVCSVQIFSKAATISPFTVLDTTTNLVNKTPLMAFAASGQLAVDNPVVHCVKPGATVAPCIGAFSAANYFPTTTASGIYRLGVGDYVVALNNSNASLSGWDYTTSTMTAASAVSAVGEYVDIWTVRLTPGSRTQVFINNFTLSEDTFFSFTERLLLTTSNKLLNKDIRLGETIDLKVTTEATIQNKNLPQSMINIFKDAIITNPAFEVRKINYDDPKRGSVVVPLTGIPDITSDNTMIQSFSTNGISSDVGSKYGTYSLQAAYTLLNQTIVSPLFYFTVS